MPNNDQFFNEYEQILQNFLDETRETYRSYKRLAEKALAQASDEDFFRAPDEESNSLAVIVKHLSGNLRSRWTDFLTTDGEKPERHRDTEFISDGETRESITTFWESGWNTVLHSLDELKIEDLGKIVTIRGENFTVVRAINRSLTHAAYHVGQIVYLAKHWRAGDWQTLSIPKNKSLEFYEYLNKKEDKGNYLETAGEFAEKEQ